MGLLFTHQRAGRASRWDADNIDESRGGAATWTKPGGACWRATFDLHYKVIDLFLQACARKTIRVKHVKCSFAKPEGAALGIIFDGTYARIDKERIKDRVQRVPPDTRRQKGYIFIGDGDILQRFRRGR